MRSLLICFFLLVTLGVEAQDIIKVAVKSTGTFIETYQSRIGYVGDSPLRIYGKTQKMPESHEVVTYKKAPRLIDAYRLGPSAAEKLKKGIRIALKWIELNRIHKKEFEKEICRFVGMDTNSYKSFGYAAHLAEDMILIFNGHSDSSFVLELKRRSLNMDINFIEFSNAEMVINFKDLLDGISVNKEIDDIFKN